MRYFIYIIILITIYSSGYGQNNSPETTNRDTFCLGLNIGTSYSFYSRSLIGNSDYNDFEEINSNNGVGILAGLTFHMKPKKNRHFIVFLNINAHFNRQYLKYYTEDYSHFGTSSETGDIKVFNSYLNIAIIPEVIIGKKIKTYIGIGPSFSLGLYNSFNGTIEDKNVIRVDNALSPVGYSFTRETTIYHNNDIKNFIDINYFFEFEFNLGVKIPCKKNKLLILAKINRSNNNYLSNLDSRQYLISLSITIPIK